MKASVNKIKFSFVILHYQTIHDTIECVDSILTNVKYDDFYIVIIDNNSPNGSGEKLKNKFHNHKKITVFINDKNLGFANGNNVGYLFSKNELKSDFIALINNDTIIKQNNFINLIVDKYLDEKFHILGPDIISTINDSHQNPQPLTIQNKDRLKKYIKFYKIQLLLNYVLLDKILEKVKKKVYSKPLVSPEKKINHPWYEELKNVKLHGSALIFSSDYIQNYNGLNPGTFMYAEESILYFIAQRDKLTMLYYPGVKIYHKEDSSTNSFYKKNYKKRRFYYTNFIKSGKVLLNLMENVE